MKKLILFALMLSWFSSHGQFENVGFEIMDNNCSPTSCATSQNTMDCVEGWHHIDYSVNGDIPLLRKENCGNNYCMSDNAILIFNGLNGPVSGPESSVWTFNPLYNELAIPHVINMDFVVLPVSWEGTGIHVDGLTFGITTESLGFVTPSQVGVCESTSMVLHHSVVEEEQLVFRTAKESGAPKEHHSLIDNISYCGTLFNIDASCGVMEFSYNSCATDANVANVSFFIDAPNSENDFGGILNYNNTSFNSADQGSIIEPGEYIILYGITYQDGTYVDYNTTYTVEPVFNECCHLDPPTDFYCNTNSTGRFLSWNSVPGADYYEITILQNNLDCSCPIIGNSTIVTVGYSNNNYFFLIEDFEDFSCFSWTVRALCENGTQSEESVSNCFDNGNCSSKRREDNRQADRTSDIEPQIYPNPTSNELNMSFNDPELLNLSVDIYNLDGKLVKSFAEETHPNGIYKKNWNIENQLADGIYFVFFRTNVGTFQKKIVISK